MATLTSKRQVTFPAETCKALGIKPGDTIELESRREDGKQVWVLRTRPANRRGWVGCLHGRATKVADHSMTAVRQSIAAGRREGE